MVVQIILCRHCQSQNVIRHGCFQGVQRCRCHDCGRTFRQNPGSASRPEEFKAQVLAAYQERPSMRGISRIFGISRDTLSAWLKKSEVTAAPAPDTGNPPARGGAGTG